MKYKFNLKIQSMYGLLGFFSALFVIYIVTKKLDWITPISIFIINFVIGGFYTSKR